jgi:hypothetical protein
MLGTLLVAIGRGGRDRLSLGVAAAAEGPQRRLQRSRVRTGLDKQRVSELETRHRGVSFAFWTRLQRMQATGY